jgi:hypothetical protein
MTPNAVPATPPRCGKCSHKLSNHKQLLRGKKIEVTAVKYQCTLPLSALGRECGCALTAAEVKNLSV